MSLRCDCIIHHIHDTRLLAVALLFSGEEAYGKYVDLYTNHAAYNNLKNIGKRLGYLQYLDALLLAQKGPVHQELPKETRLTKDYESCVNFRLNCVAGNDKLSTDT